MQYKQNCTFESKIVYAQFSLQQAYFNTFLKVSEYFLLKPPPDLFERIYPHLLGVAAEKWSCGVSETGKYVSWENLNIFWNIQW